MNPHSSPARRRGRQRRRTTATATASMTTAATTTANAAGARATATAATTANAGTITAATTDPSTTTITARRRGRPVIDDKRRRMLDAALSAFAERGYHGVAVPEVATASSVSTGTAVRYFASKEALVNEVFRDAKIRLKAALLDGLPDLDPYRLDDGEAWFGELWRRLGAFARAEPERFVFSRCRITCPISTPRAASSSCRVLAPLWLAAKRLHSRISVRRSMSRSLSCGERSSDRQGEPARLPRARRSTPRAGGRCVLANDRAAARRSH